MSQGAFREEYRRDFKKFIESPGGKYYLQSLIAKEIEFTVNAANGDTTDKQVQSINKFAGVNLARDILQRFAEPPKVAKKQG